MYRQRSVENGTGSSWAFHCPGQPRGKWQLRRLRCCCNYDHGSQKNCIPVVFLQVVADQLCIVPLEKGDILMPQMVAHPHGEYQTHIAKTINRYYFKSVLNRQIPVPVKGDEQKRTNS